MHEGIVDGFDLDTADAAFDEDGVRVDGRCFIKEGRVVDVLFNLGGECIGGVAGEPAGKGVHLGFGAAFPFYLGD